MRLGVNGLCYGWVSSLRDDEHSTRVVCVCVFFFRLLVLKSALVSVRESIEQVSEFSREFCYVCDSCECSGIIVIIKFFSLLV